MNNIAENLETNSLTSGLHIFLTSNWNISNIKINENELVVITKEGSAANLLNLKLNPNINIYTENEFIRKIVPPQVIDIYSKGNGCELSNFATHPFVFEGVQINSMEGFLQSLKYSNPETQKKICLLRGEDAKSAGKKNGAGKY